MCGLWSWAVVLKIRFLGWISGNKYKVKAQASSSMTKPYANALSVTEPNRGPLAWHNKDDLLMTGCDKGKYSVYCRAWRKGVGDMTQIYFSLVFELGFFVCLFACLFFRGRTKKVGLIIVSWHFLIIISGVKKSLVYNSQARWSMAPGFCYSHLALEK